MAERRLGCSEGDFDALQILRNRLVLEKISLTELQKQRGPLTRTGRGALAEAKKGARREIESLTNQIKRLERLCFGNGQK